MESDDQSSFSESSSASSSSCELSAIASEDLNLVEEDPRVMFNERTSTRIDLWRLLVIIALSVVGVSVSTFTHSFLRQGEQDDAIAAYLLFAGNVVEVLSFRSKTMFQSLRGLGETITAFEAASKNETFPFLTIPTFEVTAHHTRKRAGFESLNYTLQSFPKMIKKSGENIRQRTFIDGWSQASALEPSNFQETGTVPPVSTGTGSNVTSIIPLWMISPPPFSPDGLNLDFLSIPPVANRLMAMNELNDIVMSDLVNLTGFDPTGLGYLPEEHDALHDASVSRIGNEPTSSRPHLIVYGPVYSQLGNSSSYIPAILLAQMAFDFFLGFLLPEGVGGIHAVVRSSCDKSFTYNLNGTNAIFLGYADEHDPKFDDKAIRIDFSDYADPRKAQSVPGHCIYTVTVYPTDTFVNGYRTSVPVSVTIVCAATFVLMVALFFVYDRFVERRNAKVVDAATRASTIVSNLFPSNVRNRLYAQAEKPKPGTHARLSSFLQDGETEDNKRDNTEIVDHRSVYKTKPIAELFPETTIMFADIAGFTAWSSSREPTHVFQLLETLYYSFDEIARARSVFKVETVGDCYVAVAGLPDARRDHAIVMAYFARECMSEMHALTKKLEVTLGPDTGDLSIRIGLHSGPVTAGVLRGERSRFQLFGDTMNVASRMESTGARGQIQISRETAHLLMAAGKDSCFFSREDKIVAKGKGQLETYWLRMDREPETEIARYGSDADSYGFAGEKATADFPTLGAGKVSRLVDWTVDALALFLKQIVTKNGGSQHQITLTSPSWAHDESDRQTLLEEVQETIALPHFNRKLQHQVEDVDNIELDPEVMSELHEFVSNITSMYHANPFHNFEHASHVAMSVTKLLSRIVAPVDIVDEVNGSISAKTVASHLHDHTYGITSDPLTQFSCVFSALIHDVDHPGVPNSQLIKEDFRVAALYKKKIGRRTELG